MSEEISHRFDPVHQTGLTLEAEIFSVAGTPVSQSPVSLAEVGTTAIYTGDVDYSTGFVNGTYLISIVDTVSGRQLAEGSVGVFGGLEVIGASEAKATTNTTDIIAEIDANEAKIDLLETKAEADIRQVALIAEHDTTQTDISNIPATDISSLETKVEADIRQVALIDNQDIIIARLVRLLKSDVNNQLLDKLTGLVTLYDDDGTTPIDTWDIVDSINERTITRN